jgi:hypothetical protein
LKKCERIGATGRGWKPRHNLCLIWETVQDQLDL